MRYMICCLYLILLHPLILFSHPTNSPTYETSIGDSADTPTYRLKYVNGSTCILLQGDIFIQINYTVPSGKKVSEIFIPEDPNVSGNCESANNVGYLVLTWGGYSFKCVFIKIKDEKYWFVSYVKLTFSTDIPAYHRIKTYGSKFSLMAKQTLFKTPLQKSYFCDDNDIIVLAPENKQGKAVDLIGSVYIKQLHLQPFIYSKDSAFGPTYDCTSETFDIDIMEWITIFIYVLVVLIIIFGCYIYRREKLKQKRRIAEKQLK